jgi:pimeloyl-ACP methyl ester carboxylesterase
MYPDDSGYVEREGVRTYWEVYGHGEPTIFFLPTWSLVHSRIWKAQVAYFARHFRVLLMDGRGNGHSDRPAEPSAYQPWEFANDALAVMDATGTDRAVLVSTSMGTMWNLILCAGSPDRVLGSCFIGPAPYAVTEEYPPWALTPFNERLDSHEGWNRHNRHFIREHYAEFARYWCETCVPETHSTRPTEFTVDMCLDTTPEVVLATLDASGADAVNCLADTLKVGGETLPLLAKQVKCPTLVVNGGLELVCPQPWADALARDTGGESLFMPDAGHCPQGRKPVEFNLALRAFVERLG